MPHRTRKAKYYQSGPDGEQYKVLEYTQGFSDSVRVTVLTVINGGRSLAALKTAPSDCPALAQAAP